MLRLRRLLSMKIKTVANLKCAVSMSQATALPTISTLPVSRLASSFFYTNFPNSVALLCTAARVVPLYENLIGLMTLN